MKSSVMQYAKDERELRKKYRDLMQMVLFVIFAVFSLLFCAMFGLNEDENPITPQIFLIFALFAAIGFNALSSGTYYIAERNQNRNIFEKYLFVPRKMKDIFWAKLLVLARDAALMTFIGQMVVLLVNLLFHGGKIVIYPETFAPFYVGLIVISESVLELWIMYQRARANR